MAKEYKFDDGRTVIIERDIPYVPRMKGRMSQYGRLAEQVEVGDSVLLPTSSGALYLQRWLRQLHEGSEVKVQRNDDGTFRVFRLT